MTAGDSTSSRRPPVHAGSLRDRSDSIGSSEISADDIMRWADRTRVSSAKQSRRGTLQMIQSYMFRDPKRLPRPQTSRERKLAIRERPLTARSLCSEPPPPVTTPVAFDLLTGEGLESETEDESPSPTTCLAQQCCELLGPSMCQMCAKNIRAQRQRSKYERSFRSLRVSEENFTTAALVQKNMPQLSLSEVQDRVAAGAVSQQQLRRLHEIRDSPEEIEKRRAEKERELKEASLRPKGCYSLREMNRRLAEGDTGFRRKKQARLSVTELLFPSFISPRKVKQYDEPLFRVYYEPPLVAKHRQKSEPTFFAGSSFDYKLPDRLPDKIVFTPIVRAAGKKLLSKTKRSAPLPPAEPLDYEATFLDTVDNLIKEHLDR